MSKKNIQLETSEVFGEKFKNMELFDSNRVFRGNFGNTSATSIIPPYYSLSDVIGYNDLRKSSEVKTNEPIVFEITSKAYKRYPHPSTAGENQPIVVNSENNYDQTGFFFETIHPLYANYMFQEQETTIHTKLDECLTNFGLDEEIVSVYDLLHTPMDPSNDKFTLEQYETSSFSSIKSYLSKTLTPVELKSLFFTPQQFMQIFTLKGVANKYTARDNISHKGVGITGGPAIVKNCFSSNINHHYAGRSLGYIIKNDSTGALIILPWVSEQEAMGRPSSEELEGIDIYGHKTVGVYWNLGTILQMNSTGNVDVQNIIKASKIEELSKKLSGELPKILINVTS